MGKELFGEELWGKIEVIIKEKGLNLILDNKEKPEYIPKSRFDEVIGVRNELKTQVGELTNQLDTLKKAAKGNDELVKQIEALQNQNTEWESKYKNSLLESAIKIKALSSKARDAGDLVKFLDMSKLVLEDDGNVKGLDEQLKTLKETKGYLFEVSTSNPPPNPPNGGNTQTEEQQIQNAHAEALKTGNMPLAIALKNKLTTLINNKKG
jgi:uncharacterized protein YhaN